MLEEPSASLKAIDLAILTDVVCQDQRTTSLRITEWSVERLSDKGMANPDGSWLISGRGDVDGKSCPWSVVVKIIARPGRHIPQDARTYWKREFEVAKSGLAERLRGPVRAPRFYRADDHSENVWIWMENVQDGHPGRWTFDDYIFAARQLGRWNGTTIKLALPAEPWLAKNYHREWENVVNLEDDWKSPLHQKYITADIRNRFARLWKDREQFYFCLENLPQCFTHFDCQRRNLFIQTNTQNENIPLLVLDWGLCGVSALGTELQALVGGSTTFVEWPSSDLGALDAGAFTNYIEGLREAGWSGDPDLVRLGYVAMLAIYRGAILPHAMANWFCTPNSRERDLRQFGIAGEDLYLQFLGMLLYWLDCADEVRNLMIKMRFL